MPVSTIISTPAHPQANSFVSIAEAEQYFSDLFGTHTWDSASNDQKQQALIEATRIINAERFFYDILKSYTQRLKWPRTNARRFTGSPTSATNNTMTDTQLVNDRTMPDDYWNYGTIWFYNEGDDNFNQYYLITDFDSSTGVVTIDGTFSSVPDTSESYELIQEIPPEIKWAVCETAEAILAETLIDGSTGNIKSQKLGDESVEYFDKSVQTVNIPAKALDLIEPYLARAGRVVTRGLFR